MAKMYLMGSLTGGGATAIDSIDGAGLTEGDFCAVPLVGGTYGLYRLNATYGGVESSPSYILPDTNPGLKGWQLCSDLGAITNIENLSGASTFKADIVSMAFFYSAM